MEHSLVKLFDEVPHPHKEEDQNLKGEAGEEAVIIGLAQGFTVPLATCTGTNATPLMTGNVPRFTI